MVAENALSESTSNGRGPGVQREIYKLMCKPGSLLSQLRSSLRHCCRNRERDRGRDDDVGGGAESTSAVRHIFGRMHVRYLDGRAEKQ